MDSEILAYYTLNIHSGIDIYTVCFHDINIVLVDIIYVHAYSRIVE